MYNFDYIPKEESDINDSLINLYGSHLLALYAALKPIYDGKDYAVKPALPFLLWPKNDGSEWTNADLKVMIYGRETNGWDNPDSRERKMEPNWTLNNSDDVRNEIGSIQNIMMDTLTLHLSRNKITDSSILGFILSLNP